MLNLRKETQTKVKVLKQVNYTERQTKRAYEKKQIKHNDKKPESRIKQRQKKMRENKT